MIIQGNKGILYPRKTITFPSFLKSSVIIIYICIQKQPNTFKKEFGMVCKWISVYYYTKKYNKKKGIMKNARK